MSTTPLTSAAKFISTIALAVTATVACGSSGSDGSGGGGTDTIDAEDVVVVYQCGGTGNWTNLCSINLDGSDAQALTTEGTTDDAYAQPSATPDGSKLSFTYGGQLYILDVAAGETTGPLEHSGALLANHISPSGDQVMSYFVLNQSGALYAYVTLWSSSGPIDQTPDYVLSRYFTGGFSIGWGPNGSGVLFVARNDTTHANNDVCISEGDDADCDRVIVSDTEARLSLPALSPDGTQLALVGADDDGYEGHLRLYDYATGELLGALTDGTYDSNPAWSPDGSVIVFERGNASGTTDLYAIASTGVPGDERLLVENGIQPTVSVITEGN